MGWVINEAVTNFVVPNAYWIPSKRTKWCKNKRKDYDIYKHKLFTIKKKNILDYVQTRSNSVRWKRKLSKGLRDNWVFTPLFRAEDLEPIGRLHTVKSIITLSSILKQNRSKISKSRRSILTDREQEWLREYGRKENLNIDWI